MKFKYFFIFISLLSTFSFAHNGTTTLDLNINGTIYPSPWWRLSRQEKSQDFEKNSPFNYSTGEQKFSSHDIDLSKDKTNIINLVFSDFYAVSRSKIITSTPTQCTVGKSELSDNNIHLSVSGDVYKNDNEIQPSMISKNPISINVEIDNVSKDGLLQCAKPGSIQFAY